MPLTHALRRAHPSAIARDRSSCIYVAMLSEQNQQLVPLISGAVLPGGVSNFADFSRRDRAGHHLLAKRTEKSA